LLFFRVGFLIFCFCSIFLTLDCFLRIFERLDDELYEEFDESLDDERDFDDCIEELSLLLPSSSSPST
jgi:hypothetical protein